MTPRTLALCAVGLAALPGCGSSVDSTQSSPQAAAKPPHRVAPSHGQHHADPPKVHTRPFVAWPGFAHRVDRTCRTTPPPPAPAAETRLTEPFAKGAVARIGRLRGRLGTLDAPHAARERYVQLAMTLQRLQTMYGSVAAGVVTDDQARSSLYRGIVVTTQQSSDQARQLGAPTCAS